MFIFEDDLRISWRLEQVGVDVEVSMKFEYLNIHSHDETTPQDDAEKPNSLLYPGGGRKCEWDNMCARRGGDLITPTTYHEQGRH